MASASIPSANEPAKDFILVHTVQLKPMIKAQISGRMVSSGITDVAFASVHSEKTRLKKLMEIIIIIIIMNKSGFELHLIHSKESLHFDCTKLVPLQRNHKSGSDNSEVNQLMTVVTLIHQCYIN